MKTLILWLATVLVFGVSAGLVAQKEYVIHNGRTVLLRLAPRDPRSLMQGDYMVLNNELSRMFSPIKTDGYVVLKVDEKGMGTFVREHAGEALAAGEQLLRYRKRAQARFGAESFFFEEGKGNEYAQARFGELKVSASGESVLVGLRDEQLRPLGRK